MVNRAIGHRDVYCPSMPVFEDGKQVGWWYGVHVTAEGSTYESCPRCGLSFDRNNGVIEGKA